MLRPRPENCLLFGPVTYSNQAPLIGASVSLIDPASHKVLEKIPTDKKGWYLFSVRKGKIQALLVETAGFFPYYFEITVPVDYQEQSFNHPVTVSEDLRQEYFLVFAAGDTVLDEGSTTVVNQLALRLKKDPALSIWFNPQGESFDPVRINQVTGRFRNEGIPVSRILTGTRPETFDTIIEVRIGSRTGDQGAGGTVIKGDMPDETWTIQFTASKKRIDVKTFTGLKPVYEFKGKDGFYRYTYGSFLSREDASNKIAFVREKGFKQAFTKTVGSIKKL